MAAAFSTLLRPVAIQSPQKDSDLTRSIRGAVYFSVAGNFGGLLINLALIVTASHLLTPAQVGAFVVAMAFITLIEIFRDLGTSVYVIQTKNLDRSVLGSLFGVSLSISIPIGILTIISAPLFSKMMGNSSLSFMVMVMSISYFIAPITVPVIATFQRDLRFQETLVMRLGGASARASVSIYLIFAGYGPISLAWGIVASKAMECLLLLVIDSPYKFVKPNIRDWKLILRFGIVTTTSTSIGNIGAAAADMVTGRLLGLAAAGIYNRGNSLVTMYRTGIEAAISPVAYSTFAREARKDDGDMRHVFLTSVTHLSGFGWPAFAVLPVLAEPAIRIMFGPQWLESVPVARVLAFAGAIHLVAVLAPVFLIASGKAGLLIKRELLIQVPRLGLIIAAAHFSVVAVAWAIVLTYLLTVVVTQRVLNEVAGITYIHLWKATWTSVPLALSTALPCWGLATLAADFGGGPAMDLAAGILGAAIGWSAGLFAFNHPNKAEVTIVTNKIVQKLAGAL